MPEKVDFKKQLDCYRAVRDRFRILEVPPLQYLMVDGHGDPNTSGEFAAAVSALYPVAYKLKFASKQKLGRDYVVMPLEGRWWAEDMAAFTAARDKSRWNWTLMIMVPDWIGPELLEAAVAKAAAGGPTAALDRVRLQRLAEGTCVQTLHLGPFDEEAAVLERMHREFIPGQGLRMTGEHHEIYLSDFRRVAPGKLRTILRQPVTADR
ncbi:GyrI-like domain-containing protein [Sciscionella marina]|uniref:GyrI-like domain-containing protein n=1 Tax=Sciscionella marina TaxID=508770 RepID=UPI00036DDD46|nr:GyrI-like domain-containing protein [Sciscionella marina]